ncbi:MAG TPA: ATP-binding cassette domain-containing protein, partial [Terriglobales bacterium]|nr:ATP-binding cassette domain-containing protein [Terriglobales bacterium]
MEASFRAMISRGSSEPLIIIKDLKKWYPIRKKFLTKLRAEDEYVHAVDGVTIEMRKGEALALVGESGCGKTTLARMLLRLVDPTEGIITFKGRDLFALNKRELRKIRTQMQPVFQDPYASLDPKQTILQIISEPLRVNNLVKDRKQMFDRVTAVLS